MAIPDQTITPRLLESAKSEFLNMGFEAASINVICKNANITTGALYKRFSTKEQLFNSLVEKPAEQLRNRLEGENEAYHKLSKREQLNRAFSNWYEDKTFIGFIYEFKDEFMLILKCATGTKYESYFDELADIITHSTIKFIKNVYINNLETSISNDLVHILVSSYIKGILESLMHNMSLEEAKVYESYLKRFFLVGWKDLLKI